MDLIKIGDISLTLMKLGFIFILIGMCCKSSWKPKGIYLRWGFLFIGIIISLTSTGIFTYVAKTQVKITNQKLAINNIRSAIWQYKSLTGKEPATMQELLNFKADDVKINSIKDISTIGDQSYVIDSSNRTIKSPGERVFLLGHIGELVEEY